MLIIKCNFLQLLWCDGRQSWVKETNLPKRILEIVKKGGRYELNTSSVDKFGQKRTELKLKNEEEVECGPKVMQRQVTILFSIQRFFAKFFKIHIHIIP